MGFGVGVKTKKVGGVKELSNKYMTKGIKKASTDMETVTNEISDTTSITQSTGAFNIEVLMSQAITNKVPVETMERLLGMRRELKAEFAKEAYDRAMADFQAECPTIQKTKSVKTKSGAVAYQYAPIESIVSQIKAILQKHGFSYSTRMELLPDGVKVTCKVTHASGHSEESPMQVPLGTKTDIMSQTQVVAAAQTFAKRYAFCNAFGILTGDEDDDAVSTKQIETQTMPVSNAKAYSTSEPSKAQSDFITKLMNERHMIDEDLKIMGYETITKANASVIIDALKAIPIGVRSAVKRTEIPTVYLEDEIPLPDALNEVFPNSKSIN